MNIVVVALGKMGLPVAAFYAQRGHHVIGVDRNPAVVAAIAAGQSLITHEPGLSEIVARCVASGHLCATTDTTAAVAGADVVIVLVPLDVAADHQPDYRALDSAFAAIGAGLGEGALVILETTVAVGDTRGRFLALLEAGGRRHGRDFELVFSPERVQSGTVYRDMITYPRVVGGLTPAGAARAAAFYSDNLGVETRLLPDAEAAEFCKLAESIYRDVNIALANELARYAEQCGVDLRMVIPVANSQPQSHIHQPGVGVGGHCIPIYPYLVTSRTADARLASLAREVNDAMPAHAVTRLEAELGGLDGRRVLILGVTYRPGVKEVAHSPAFALTRELTRRGAVALAHDPLLSPIELRRLDLEPGDPADPAGCDAIILQTAHQPYLTLDWGSVTGLRVVFDGRGALDGAAVMAAGVRYLAIGRAEPREAPTLAGPRP